MKNWGERTGTLMNISWRSMEGRFTTSYWELKYWWDRRKDNESNNSVGSESKESSDNEGRDSTELSSGDSGDNTDESESESESDD